MEKLRMELSTFLQELLEHLRHAVTGEDDQAVTNLEHTLDTICRLIIMFAPAGTALLRAAQVASRVLRGVEGRPMTGAGGDEPPPGTVPALEAAEYELAKADPAPPSRPPGIPGLNMARELPSAQPSGPPVPLEELIPPKPAEPKPAPVSGPAPAAGVHPPGPGKLKV